MNGQKCYIAGPMRGYPEFNFPAFDAAAKQLRSEGWWVISPAEMDREQSPEVKDLSKDTVFSSEQNRMFYKRDSDALLTLRPERGDAIFFLPGWERSVGAIGEFAIGTWIGIQRIDYASGLDIGFFKLVPTMTSIPLNLAVQRME